MADGIFVKITGAKAVRANLKRFELGANGEIKDRVERILILMVNRAKKLAPFKTARLARSIIWDITDISLKLVRGVFGANTVYAAAMELGDGKHRSKKGLKGRPTRYLFPAAKDNFKRAVNELKRGMKIAMQKARKPS